jgi:ketosteroid isomerase-like protein
VALRFVSSLAAGQLEAGLKMMAEDLSWCVAGHPDEFALAGTYSKAEFVQLLARLGKAMPDGVRIEVNRVFGDHNTAAVEVRNTGRSPAGRQYDNHLVYIFEVQDGLIRAVREYLDTGHAQAIFTDV